MISDDDSVSSLPAPSAPPSSPLSFVFTSSRYVDSTGSHSQRPSLSSALREQHAVGALGPKSFAAPSLPDGFVALTPSEPHPADSDSNMTSESSTSNPISSRDYPLWTLPFKSTDKSPNPSLSSTSSTLVESTTPGFFDQYYAARKDTAHPPTSSSPLPSPSRTRRGRAEPSFTELCSFASAVNFRLPLANLQIPSAPAKRKQSSSFSSLAELDGKSDPLDSPKDMDMGEIDDPIAKLKAELQRMMITHGTRTQDDQRFIS